MESAPTIRISKGYEMTDILFHAKCINSTVEPGHHPQLGQVYPIVRAYDSAGELMYDFLGLDGHTYKGWFQSRFKQVGGEAVQSTNCSVVSTPGIAVNDHVCGTCGNARCSKAEKSCWRCGNSL
jgi:hypothetical protein